MKTEGFQTFLQGPPAELEGMRGIKKCKLSRRFFIASILTPQLLLILALVAAILWLMSQKSFIWLGMSIGCVLGGFIPSFWDAGFYSLWGMIFIALGGFVGIFVGFKFSEMMEG